MIIKEDYVSFEIAQLLKEKGFDGDCDYWYDEYGGRCCSPSVISVECWCPSQSLALKWLREVHKIHINLDIHWLHFASQNGWMYIIERILDNGVDYIDSKGDERDITFFQTYEQAVEAALLYTLKNLI